MGIRSKFFLVVGPLMIAVVFFVYSVISERFLAQFTAIEMDLAQQNIDRAFDAVNATVDDISTKITDWAQWDDTYVFMEDRNAEYWQSNLSVDDILDGMKLSGMVFVDTSGAVVASKNVFDNNPDSDVIPQDILQELLDGIFVNNDGIVSHQGIIHVQGQYFMVASRSIFRTDGSGPSMGTLIFIRLLDDDLIGEIAARIHLPLQFYSSVDDLALSDVQKEHLLHDKSNNAMDDVIVIEENVVAGYGVVHSAVDQDPLFARIEIPRTIYNQGQSTVIFFSIFIAIAFVVFTILLVILLEWLVFSPLSRLGVDVTHIQKDTHTNMHIPVRGNDQFTVLSTTINDMLDSLYLLEQQNKESEDRFQTISDNAPVMIWMANPTGQVTFFNKVWLDFTGKTLKQEIGNGWLEGVHPDDVEHASEIMKDAFDNRKVFHAEFRLRFSDGTYRWVMDHGVPYFSSDKTFLGYLGSCIDITDWKNMQAQQIEKMNELETMNKMMVSRELKMIELKEELQKLKG